MNPYGGLVASVFSLPNKILIFGGKPKGSDGNHVAFLNQSIFVNFPYLTLTPGLNGLKSFQVDDLPIEESSSSIFLFNDEFIIQKKSHFSKVKLSKLE